MAPRNYDSNFKSVIFEHMLQIKFMSTSREFALGGMPEISQHWFREWASYQIRKIAGYSCAGNAGNVFRATDLLTETAS